MSRRQNLQAGAQPESSVQLRWHSVANPDTPSLDIMSSPDPLNDTLTADHIPSSNTRRVTRSQRAHKFLSLGPSPRRQSFELDTGNSRSARRALVVSVEETDEDDTQVVPTQSPGRASTTPRARENTTTTTTVPLKYSVEDESSDVLGSTNATPRPRKTRIRTSNGTPIPKPTTGKRRRDPTPPGRRISGRPGTVEDSMESDSMSDELTQRSPTPKRRMRSPRNRAAEPSSELGTEPVPAANPVRRVVRSRRQSIASDRSAGRADAAHNAAMVNQVPTSEDDLQRDMTITETSVGTRGMSTLAADAELESDIWMTTMSQEATPKASAQPAMKLAAQRQEREEERQPSVSISEEEYGFLAPAASDVSSADDEPPAESMTTRRNDTIAQGEDFSMILMDSIPSLQASTRSAAPPSYYSEIGDDTNLIINNTLESLRQGEVADREDEGEDDEDDDEDTLTGRESENEPAEEEPTAPEPLVADLQSAPEPEAGSDESQPQVAESDEHGRESENEPAGDKAAAPAPLVADPDSEPELEAQSDVSQPEVADPAVESASESAEGSEGDLEAELEKMAEEDNAEFERQVEQEVLAEVQAAAAEKAAREPEPAPEPTPSRQSSRRESPATPRSARLSQSPRKATNSSPLRYRVFKRYQTGGSPPASSPGADSPNQTGGVASGSAQVQESREDSMVDEDSFSDIPEAILEAAAPRQSGTAREYEELDDEQMDEVMDQLEASQGQYATTAEAAHFAEDANIEDGHEEAEFAQEQRAEQQVRPDGHELAYVGADAGEESGLEEDALMAEEGADVQAAEEVVEEAAEEQPLPSTAREAHTELRRLPTPDDSLPNSPSQQAPVTTQEEPQMESLLQSPAQPGPVTWPSSTPRSHPPSAMQQSETVVQRSGSSIEETPRNQISSVAQPQSPVQESTSAQQARPALSSIVRAGRALQSVTSDPPSPEAGDRHLGSPFRSSGSKEPRSGSKEREGSRLLSRSPGGRISKSPTSRMLTFGRLGQSSLSPNQARSPFRDSTRSIAAHPAVAQRPPQPNPRRRSSQQPSASPQRPSHLRERTKSVEPAPPVTAGPSLQDEATRAQRLTPGRVSANSSMHHSPGSEMSWVANEGPISPRLRGDNTLQDVVAASRKPAGRSAFFGKSPVRPTFAPRAPEPEPVRELEQEPEAESESLGSEPPLGLGLELPELPREPELPEQPEPELPELPREPELPALPAREDSTDIWDFEAQREAPTRPRHQSFGTSQRTRKAAQTAGRETKRNKWMRENFQPLPSVPKRFPKPVRPAVEERGSPSRQHEHSRLESEAEEFSLLARQRAAEETQKLTDSAAKASRFDLSEFFSSPMAIPSMLAGKFFPKKSKAAEAAPAPAPAPAAVPAMTACNLFPQEPPMEQVPSARRQNLFAAPGALAREQARLTPAAPKPVLGADVSSGGTRFAEDAPAPASTPAVVPARTTGNLAPRGAPVDSVPLPRRPNLFAAAEAPVPAAPARSEASEFFPGWSKPVEAAPSPAPAPPAAPAPEEDTVMARRRVYTPRVPDDFVPPVRRPNPFAVHSREQAQQSLPRPTMSEALEKRIQTLQSRQNSGVSRKSAPTPPRRQLSNDDIRKWRRNAAWSTASSIASDDSFIPPFLRTLPPKDASPEKSSLRPPTKAHTPGRVVDFTSSVLSPPEQELARQKRREQEADLEQFAQSMLWPRMSVFDDDSHRREPPLLYGYGQAQQGSSSANDKENQQGSDVSDVSMSDAPPLEQQAPKPALSQTVWTNRHWLLLKKMIRARRQRPFAERYERRSDQYLGKTVRGRDAVLQLERWHLDCVDAFRAEVGGWDEGDLVKRLFGLLAAEARRNGKAPQGRQRAVMFQ